MEKIKLEDLLPEKPEFTIGGELFKMRPPNMLDQVWIKNTWGEAFKDTLPNEDWPQVARFVYHQLDIEGQSHFRARKARIVDELTGNEADKFLTGAEVLLTSIANHKEMLGILGAVYRAIAISNPIIEEIAKKKMQASLDLLNKELPSPTPKSKIGAESSTRSRTNTGGRKRKSRS